MYVSSKPEAHPAVADIPVKLAIYQELVYRRDERGYSTDRAFILFALALREHFERLILVGRVDPVPGRAAYSIPPDVEVAELPHYKTLRDLTGLTRVLPRTLRALWRSLDGADTLWSLGPHPMSIPIALFGKARRRRVVLGVRQDFPRYVRHRLPNRRWRPALFLATVLEKSFRLLGRRMPVVTVGRDLFDSYARKGVSVLELTVSLISENDIAERPHVRALGDRVPVELLSVGRLDPEKSPLLLLEMLERLQRLNDRPWRLTIIGTGPLEDELRVAAERFGGALQVVGYVPFGTHLLDYYRSADILVHVSQTEGLPQVLIEAQALGLPIIGTDVGGVRAALDNGAAGLLVKSNDSELLTTAVRQLVDDPALRTRIAARGLELVREATIEKQAARAAAFIGDSR
jgi:glycosyltransferase involved in cell wall biosynthesis